MRDEFVMAQDKINCKEAIKLINDIIIPAEQNIGTKPDKEIEVIFEKIQDWKDKFEDSEQFEDALSARFTIYNRPGDKIKIHTIKTLMDHMNGLVNEVKSGVRMTIAEELKLTKDEVDFIVITSLDPEYFPWMLIEQSDWLKWFTTDFSGEGETEKQEEEDFMNDKLSDWVEATTLGIELVGIPPKDYEKIQDMEWWENQRFKNAGELLLNEFNTDKMKFQNFK